MTNTTPTIPAVSGNIEERVRSFREWADDPAMSLMLDPNSAHVIFPYDNNDMVLLARSPETLAQMGRSLRVTRSRRHGRPGQRRWETVPRDVDQMPKLRVPNKHR